MVRSIKVPFMSEVCVTRPLRDLTRLWSLDKAHKLCCLEQFFLRSRFLGVSLSHFVARYSGSISKSLVELDSFKMLDLSNCSGHFSPGIQGDMSDFKNGMKMTHLYLSNNAVSGHHGTYLSTLV